MLRSTATYLQAAFARRVCFSHFFPAKSCIDPNMSELFSSGGVGTRIQYLGRKGTKTIDYDKSDYHGQ